MFRPGSERAEQKELRERDVAGSEFARKVREKTALEIKENVRQFTRVDAGLARSTVEIGGWRIRFQDRGRNV